MATTPIDAFQRFKAFCDEHRTQAEAAKALGISQQHIHDLLHRRRGLSPKVLSKLGLKRVVSYIATR
jgi:plasmid maintenance system antidote protein VapI